LARADEVHARLVAYAEVHDATRAEAGDRRAAWEADVVDQLPFAIDHVVLGAAGKGPGRDEAHPELAFRIGAHRAVGERGAIVGELVRRDEVDLSAAAGPTTTGAARST